MPDLEEAQTILDQAKSLVYGDRNKAYGHPTDNFDDIAALYNAYLGIKFHDRQTYLGFELDLNNIDIAILNILQKIARLAKNQIHRDSIIDIAGYAATIERIVDKK